MKKVILTLILIGKTIYSNGQNYTDYKNIAPDFLKALKSENNDSLKFFFEKIIADNGDLNYLGGNNIYPSMPRGRKLDEYYMSKFTSFKTERLNDYSLESLQFVNYSADTIIREKNIPKLNIKFRIKTDYTEYEVTLGEMYKINNSWKLFGNMEVTNRFLIRHIKFFKKSHKTKKEIDDSLSKAYFKKVKWFVYPSFDQVSSFKEGMAAVMIGRKWGYIDSTGKITIPCSYDYCYGFSEDIAVVQKNYRWYFIKKNGEIINKSGYFSKTNYAPYSAFINGQNILQASNGKYYGIDKEGKAITDSLYDDIGRSSQGFRYACINKKCGIIDNRGKIKIPLIYDEIRLGPDTNTIIASQNGKYGVINLNGEMKINFQFLGLNDAGFKDYLVYYVRPDTGIYYYNFYKGLVSKYTGEVVVSAKYEELNSAFDGSKILAQTGRRGWLKLLDFNENSLFSVENSAFSDFGNGHFIVNLTKQKQTVEIDSNGKILKTYPLATFYRVNKNLIKIGGELVDEKTGKILIPDYVTTSFDRETDWVFLFDNISQKWGVIKFSDLPSLP